MNYFDNVKLKDDVYSIVYGKGKVNFVLEEKYRLEGCYTFEVKYANDKIFYTESGQPDWCTNEAGCQTVYYQDDMDKPELEYDSINEFLSHKKISKLKLKGKLEMRCPNGAWINVIDCPIKLFLKAMKYGDLHLFRKEP